MQHIAIEHLCDQCRLERIDYQKRGHRVSPACARLFRLAGAGNRAAWDALHRVLWPECLGWFEHWSRDHMWMEPAELAQDVWLKLLTHPPAQPVQGEDDISPAMAFLRTCALRRFLMEKRKHAARVAADDLSLDQAAFDAASDTTLGETLTADAAGASDFERADLRLSIRAVLERLLTACQQHIVRDVFILQRPRADVAQDHPECFRDAASVFEATRAVREKLSGSAELRELAGEMAQNPKTRRALASLQLNFALDEAAEDDMKRMEPCRLSEEVLLDYVLGHAAPALVTQIEQSPACVMAARRLAAEMAQWLPLLRHAECPHADALVDFFEHKLAAGPRLAIGRHVQECPHCREELALLGQWAGVFEPATPATEIALTKIKALFVSFTRRANALRGELLQFETDQLRITLDCSRSPGKARRWTLSGEVRTLAGAPVQSLSAVLLTPLAQTGGAQSDISAEVIAAEGLFVTEGIATGHYTLRLHIAEADGLHEIALDRVLSVDDAFRAEPIS